MDKLKHKVVCHDQQPKAIKADILGSADLSALGLHNSTNKQKLHPMSSEELKILGELEMDIETDLEQEIKDGIYHLALRLHRLYQHQKERNYARNLQDQNLESKSNKILSEVNINIRLEGGTKIEIKETKKEIPDKKIRPQSAKSENSRSNMLNYDSNKKKYDWAKSLRSSGSDFVSPVINRRNEKSSHEVKTDLNYDHNINENLQRVRKNLNSGAGQRKGSHVNGDVKALELGWKW